MRHLTNCLLFLACFGAASWAGPCSLLSVRDVSQDPSAPGDGDSMAPILTPDGRYVLFASTADNLVAINGSNSLPSFIIPHLNIFRRDRSNGTTALVSVNLSGTGGGDGNSLPNRHFRRRAFCAIREQRGRSGARRHQRTGRRFLARYLEQPHGSR